MMVGGVMGEGRDGVHGIRRLGSMGSIVGKRRGVRCVVDGMASLIFQGHGAMWRG